MYYVSTFFSAFAIIFFAKYSTEKLPDNNCYDTIYKVQEAHRDHTESKRYHKQIAVHFPMFPQVLNVERERRNVTYANTSAKCLTYLIVQRGKIFLYQCHPNVSRSKFEVITVYRSGENRTTRITECLYPK